MKKNTNKFYKLLLIITSLILNVDYCNSMKKDKTTNQQEREKLQELGINNVSEIHKLYVIANLILYQKAVIHLLKSCIPITEKLIDTNFERKKIKFSFNISGESSIKTLQEMQEAKKKFPIKIESEESDKDKDYVEYYITSPEAQALILKDAWKQTGKTFDAEESLEVYNNLNILMLNSSSDKDLILVINEKLQSYGKNFIYTSLDPNNSFVFQGLAGLIANLENDLRSSKLMHIRAINAINQKNFIEFFQKWLELSDLQEIVQNLMPNFVPFLKKVNQLLKLINTFETEDRNIYRPYSKKESMLLNTFINAIINEIKVREKDYEELYKKIITLRPLAIKALKKQNSLSYDKYCNHVLLAVRTATCLPNSIEENSKSLLNFIKNCLNIKIEPESSNKELENENWLDFLTQNKPVQKVSIKKKNKKSRHRPHRNQQTNTEELEAEEEQENTTIKTINNLNNRLFDIPKYADRILKWFTHSYIKNQEQSSILYHTYCPIIDLFVKKYGKVKIRPNKINNTQDNAYYLQGIIKYPNGQTQHAVFVNCYDKNDILYHRGIETKNGQEIFSEIEFNFPTPSEQVKSIEEDILEERKINLNNFYDIYNLYSIRNFKENNFCLYVDDIKNNVTLILFK
ncbi:hypothetical protein [Candidatus Babela massiliensis]|uniref:Uncharacterized protein n=1 Tax=Candidatus Babela massiliensis TaxID=673862 RepID=V6DK49_9BACT|nr:hypothetical protein [Candidatus Babela massiliensis]CDK30901.1 hypothetical protein BABL1_gene_32 [Candidatus Babela massiliensis]